MFYSILPSQNSAQPIPRGFTKRTKWGMGAAALAAWSVGCYDLTATTTLMGSDPGWTGSGRFGGSGAHLAIGLAGQDIYSFREGSSTTTLAPLQSQFGGEHLLTSIAQTHSLGFHEHSFIHGNLVGETDNIRLLYGPLNDVAGMTWVNPSWPRFWEGGQDWDIVEICDLTAAETHEFGSPSDADSHLFMSFRACPDGGGSCAGGVLEVQVSPDNAWWWVRSSQQGWHATVRKQNGSLFSNECMPISVTAHGDQAVQYLAVGDPSFDQVSVFDATRLFDGPIDSRRAFDSIYDIQDVVIEGRRDGSSDFGILAVLWASSNGRRLEHTIVTNGVSSAPHLTETLGSTVDFVQTLGLGAEGSVGHLFTFGSYVQDRRYVQE